jgi:hypothetical protein
MKIKNLYKNLLFMKGGLEKRSQGCMFNTCGNKSWNVIRGKVFYLFIVWTISGFVSC